MNETYVKELARKRAENLESFIACYVVETGLKASEIELVEIRSEDSLQITWFCKPRAQHSVHWTLRLRARLMSWFSGLRAQ